MNKVAPATKILYAQGCRPAAGESFNVSVEVRNAGPRAGDEVIQLYITDKRASVPVPIRSLRGFRRILLNPGEARTVTFTIQPNDLSLLDKEFRRVIEPGKFEIAVGGIQPGFKGKPEALTTQVLTAQIEVIRRPDTPRAKNLFFEKTMDNGQPERPLKPLAGSRVSKRGNREIIKNERTRQ